MPEAVGSGRVFFGKFLKRTLRNYANEFAKISVVKNMEVHGKTAPQDALTTDGLSDVCS
jgi:hypothetical protein